MRASALHRIDRTRRGSEAGICEEPSYLRELLVSHARFDELVP